MGTFGSFGTVRLGIYAAQKGLDVTGNNITNINTTGYTRQRLNQVSLVPSVSDRYYSIYKNRIGQGAVIAGVDQLRDPALDITFRKAQTDLSSADTKLGGLNDLAVILDEVGKGSLEQDDGVILRQLNDLRDLISKAAANGMAGGYDSLIRASADALCTLFNSYADKLAELQKTYETKLDQEITQVNDILKGIQELNISIRNADIRGDEALELRDQRNLLLDELSKYMKIDVKYSMEDVGAGTMVEKLTVSLATGNKNVLVDGKYASQLSTSSPNINPDYPAASDLPYLDANGQPTGDWNLAELTPNDNYGITLQPMRDLNGQLGTAATLPPTAPIDVGGTDLGDNDLYGSLQSLRELLTEEGEFASNTDIATDANALTKRGIPYYQKALDSLAFEFAEQMNELNNAHPVGDPDRLPGEGNLFSFGSNTNEATGTDANGNPIRITAANISVSYGWANQEISIQATTDRNAPSGDTSNLARFLDLFGRKHTFDPTDVQADADGHSYEGTFEDMLLKIQSTLAEDQMSTDSIVNNYAITVDEIYVDREGVMGVDLNDEATSLMTYQKAYTAACRLMTTLEKALDSLLAM